MDQELLQKDVRITFERLKTAMSSQWEWFHALLIRDRQEVNDKPSWGFRWHGDLFEDNGIRLMEEEPSSESPLGEWNRNITGEGFANHRVTTGDRLIAVNGFLDTEGEELAQELRSEEKVHHDGRITVKCTFLRWTGPRDPTIEGSFFTVLLMKLGSQSIHETNLQGEFNEWGLLWNEEDLEDDNEFILKGVVTESPADEWNQAHFCSGHPECCLLLGDQLLDVNGIEVSDEEGMQVALRNSRISCRFFRARLEC